MANIMIDRILRTLDSGRKLLLPAAALLTIAALVFFGLLNPTPGKAQSQAQGADADMPAFQNVSIKRADAGIPQTRAFFSPAGFVATNVTLKMLIRDVYGVQDEQISGGPEWLNSERFNIQADLPASVVDDLRTGDLRTPNHERNLPQYQLMLGSVLADRFKLVVHRESKVLPAYALVIAENGPKLQESKVGEADANGAQGPAAQARVMLGKGMLTGQSLRMADLVRMLSEQLHRPVIDKTGLTGKYDLALHWAPDQSQPSGPAADGADSPAPGTAFSGASISTAVQEQLGLKLESQQGPVETLVIDQVEKPSED
jgi:uncharacterized protein (TIGR03435 family)